MNFLILLIKETSLLDPFLDFRTARRHVNGLLASNWVSEATGLVGGSRCRVARRDCLPF